MFRENVLTHERIVDRISTTMVPVAVNYEKVQDPETKEARFLRPLMEQRRQDQGVWIITPDGKALGGFVGFGDMVARTERVIEDALKAFGPVAPRGAQPRDTHPYRGKGVRPDGSVCLAETVRRWGSNHLSTTRSPVLSSVTLSAGEFRSLALPEATAGREWVVPDDVARKFSRLTSPLCYQHAPQPKWATEARLAARVREVKDGRATVVYEGRLSTVHDGPGGGRISGQEVRLTGEGVYDVGSRSLRSLLLVGSGTLRWTEDPDKPATFDALVEWTLAP